MSNVGEFPQRWFLGTALKFRERRKNSSSLVYVLHKAWNQAFSRRSRAVTAKKCANWKSVIHVQSCFLAFSLPSSLLKLRKEAPKEETEPIHVSCRHRLENFLPECFHLNGIKHHRISSSACVAGCFVGGRSTKKPQTTEAKDFKVRLTYLFSPKHCQRVKGLIQPVNCAMSCWFPQDSLRFTNIELQFCLKQNTTLQERNDQHGTTKAD